MKKKMHVVQLNGRYGWARRMVCADDPDEVYWISGIPGVRTWHVGMNAALEWLESNGVTDIERITKLSY